MEPEIIKVSEAFRIDEAGGTRRVRQVLYKVGDDGPFSLDFEEAEFDPDRVLERVRLEADKLTKLRGRS